MMVPSCVNIRLGTMLCVVLFLLITLCSANDNSSKPHDKGTSQQTSSYGSCGYTGCFCAPGIPGIPGSPGPAGPAGVAGAPGNHGLEGPIGPRGNKGDKGAHGKQGLQGPKGASGNKGKAGPRGSQGPPGPKGPQGSSGSVGPPGNKGDAGARGSQGPPGPKAAPGSLRRNWKQCVFKNLNDGRDSGLIKDCVFKKMSENTWLRVFWSGSLNIYHCNRCCRRWYFTFNGAECSAPAAIDGLVYMHSGTGRNTKSLHRVRQIEGVCEKAVHKGTVRVGFWVGNCHGYGSADANTGWNSVSRIYVEEIPPPQA